MKKRLTADNEATTVEVKTAAKAGTVQRLDRDPNVPIDEILMLEEDREDNPRNPDNYGGNATGRQKMKYEELKASIKETGQLYPIDVYYNKTLGAFCLSQGWQRLTAMKELKAEGHPIEFAKCTRVADNKQERAFLHLTANMGTPLEEIDKALQIKRLNQLFGVSLMTISKRIGMSYTKVTTHASFMEKATEPLIEAVRAGKIKMTTAKAIIAEAKDSLEINKLLKEGIEAARQKKKEQIAQRRNEEAAKAKAKADAENPVAVVEPVAAAEPEAETPVAVAEPVVAAPKRPGRPKKQVSEPTVEPVAVAAPSAPVDGVEEGEPSPVVEPEPIFTADDISDDEVGDVTVQSSDIASIKNTRLNRLGFESKLVIALKRAADMGDKVSQPLVSRIASIVELINESDFATDIHADALVAMFGELQEEE